MERRQVLENIAGISVYEEKKAKTMLELEKVDVKLNEAEIILTERETNLRELKKDRDQALKYKEIQTDIVDHKATHINLQQKERIGRIEELDKKINENKNQIEQINNIIAEHKNKITSFKTEIKNINMELDEKGEKEQINLRNQIGEIKEGLIKAGARTDTLKSELKKIESRKGQLVNNIKEVQDKIKGLESSKLKLTSEIKKNSDELSSTIKKIKEFKEKHGLENFSDLNELEKSIDLLNNDIVNLNNILSNECPNNLPQQECNIINESIFNLNRVKSNLRNNEIKINNLLKSTNTTALSQQISIIKKSKAEIKRDIINLNNSIYNYTNNIITIANELNKTSEFLDVYTNKDPKNIVRAVTLKIKNVFGNRTYFEFLAPGLILTMLLFTTLLIVSSNIVEERKKGTLARTLLSPTRIPTLIFAKNLYFLILCLIEIIAMLIIAVLFGVSLDITLGSIIILVLAAINFIAIGLFIGSVSTSENTALLTSLVITLPMFFLSNQFFPLDIMPGFIKSLGSIMPLTLSIHNLDRLIIYGTEINVNQIMLLIIYPLIISFFSYLMIKRKPTSN